MAKKRSVKPKKTIKRSTKKISVKKVSIPSKKKGFLGLFGKFTPLIFAALSFLLSMFFLNPGFTGKAVSTSGAGALGLLGLFYFILGLFCSVYYFAKNFRG